MSDFEELRAAWQSGDPTELAVVRTMGEFEEDRDIAEIMVGYGIDNPDVANAIDYLGTRSWGHQVPLAGLCQAGTIPEFDWGQVICGDWEEEFERWNIPTDL